MQQMLLKLQLFKTSLICLQMYKICSKIHQKHLIKQNVCFLLLRDLEWVIPHKQLQHSIAQGFKTAETCGKQPSQPKKDLRTLTIHYLLNSIIKSLYKEALQIRDRQ